MDSNQTISSSEPTLFPTFIFLFDSVRISELSRRRREPTALKLPTMSYTSLPQVLNSTNNLNTRTNISNTNTFKPTSIPNYYIFPSNRQAIPTNQTAPPRSCSPSVGLIGLQRRRRPWALPAVGASTVVSLGSSTISSLGCRGSC